MSYNLPLIRRSPRVLPFLLNFPCMAEGGIKLYLRSKFTQIVRGGLIIEGGIMSSEYGMLFVTHLLCWHMCMTITCLSQSYCGGNVFCC